MYLFIVNSLRRAAFKRPNKKGEIVLTRLGIGHSHLTHSYLLARQDKPTLGLSYLYTFRWTLSPLARMGKLYG